MSEQEYGSAGAVQDQGAPLTQEEKRLVNRLFSEPLEFPTVFRNWLKNFIEGSGIVLPKSSIATGVGGGSGSFAGLPAGCIFPMAGLTVPTGSLPCNGQEVSREQYDGLFKAIGTGWGAGDGSTTFNLPDLRDRALYGMGSHVGMTSTDERALGARGGPYHHHNWALEADVYSGGYNTMGGGTDGAGGHGHSLGGQIVKATNNADGNLIVPTGSGSDAFYTTGVGDHGHNVSVGGDVGVWGHVSGGGPTSGGGGDDHGGFAGVQYVITT